jgi:hypothetical protein
MKKLIILLGLVLCWFAASAQPTSFGGITPGKTTREELKGLVQKSADVRAKDAIVSVRLKQPEGQYVTARLQNDVVYEVHTMLFEPELKSALTEKYGHPNIKVGAIKKVTCKNNFGASFMRFDGEEELRWPVKDGVQGLLNRWTAECGVDIYEMYVLRHVATVRELEDNSAEQAKKEADEKRRKLGDAF